MFDVCFYFTKNMVVDYNMMQPVFNFALLYHVTRKPVFNFALLYHVLMINSHVNIVVILFWS